MEDKLKKLIIKRLSNTYCRLKVSNINGVGVFAVRDIPKGINPFKGIPDQEWIKIKMEELAHLDKEILKMIDDFLVIKKNNTVLVPEFGLNGMDISFFLNHSDNPNIKRNPNGEFVTIREIKKDEEITVSYSTYDHKYK